MYFRSTARARAGGVGAGGWLAWRGWRGLARARACARVRAPAPAPARVRVRARVRACACAPARPPARPCARVCARLPVCARPPASACAPVRLRACARPCARASRVRARNDTTTADGSRSESVRYAKPRHYAPPVCRAVDGPPRHYASDPSHTPPRSSNGFCTSYPQLDIMRHHSPTTLRA